ncbi:MAG: glycosyltransferase family 2 protein [Bacteroidota bacterium]
MNTSSDTKRKKLSLVVPVYYEEECILQFIKETGEVLQQLPLDYEIVFVDDGSTDRTVELIKQEIKNRSYIKLIELSYNQGKNAAVTAGITYATGDYIIYMDPDLQDPPVEIPHFISEIEKGYDLVFGIRKEKMDGLMNKLLSLLFWITLDKFTGLKIPKGLAVMRIFNRKFANKFLEYPEQNRFIEGIFMHIGMKRTQLVIDQRERFAGKTKFTFKRKMRLAFNIIFDYSEIPLKMAVRLGFFLVFIGAIFLIGILIAKILITNLQIGWASTLGSIILGTGLQLFFTGIAALYVGRIYKETKRRPLFSVKELTGIQN